MSARNTFSLKSYMVHCVATYELILVIAMFKYGSKIISDFMNVANNSYILA